MKPKVAVVIPCRNERNHIQKCVELLLANDYGAEHLDIAVVDGMSDDGTREVIDQLATQYAQVKRVDNLKQTTPQAFNLGINNTEGDFVIIVGARLHLEANYISTCVEILQTKPEVACVGGIINNQFSNETSQLIAAAMGSSFGVGGGNFRAKSEDGYVDTVATPVYHRAIFDEVGLFDEDLIRNQDDEFNFRVTKAGHKIWFTAKTSMDYYVRTGFSKLSRQYKQYGYWKVLVGKKHRSVSTVRQLIPLLLVLYAIPGCFVALVHPFLAWAYLLGWGLYVLGGWAMAFKENKNPAKALQVWITFLILHFSYGWGYLQGIFDFLLLNKKSNASQKQLSR